MSRRHFAPMARGMGLISYAIGGLADLVMDTALHAALRTRSGGPR